MGGMVWHLAESTALGTMVAPMHRQLLVLDEATRLLAEAKSLDQIKSIRDKAEAARTYARAAQLGLDLQNRAAELKLRAERRAGSFLASLRLRGGDRRSKGHRVPLKLDELGISRQQSKRWQSVASVPDKEFEQYLKASNDLGKEVTSAGLLRIAKKTPNPRVDNRPDYASARQSSPTQTHNAGGVDELILEMTNHCQLLASVLRPLYEGGELQFKRGERRVVGRLLGELSELLKQLKKAMTSNS